jgi:hypothetical protein
VQRSFWSVCAGRRRAAVLVGPLYLDPTGSLPRAQMAADGATSPVAGRPAEGLLTEPTAVARPGARELVFMPLWRPLPLYSLIRRREVAEDRCARGSDQPHGGAGAEIPAAARKVSARQMWIALAILAKILKPQMDQNGGW